MAERWQIHQASIPEVQAAQGVTGNQYPSPGMSVAEPIVLFSAQTVRSIDRLNALQFFQLLFGRVPAAVPRCGETPRSVCARIARGERLAREFRSGLSSPSSAQRTDIHFDPPLATPEAVDGDAQTQFS